MAAVAVLSATSAGAAAPPSKKAPATNDAPAAVKSVVQNCDAHKFETIVHAVVDGQLRDSKIKLCGVVGQRDGDWINTLRDAIRKLRDNTQMADAVRDQIINAINAEIARLTIIGVGTPRTTRIVHAEAAPAAPLSREYSALPPMPPPRDMSDAPIKGDAAAMPPPRETRPPLPIQKDFAELPPLPTAPPPATTVLPRPRLVPAVAPRLSFGCDTPGEMASDAPCADFQRETMLTIHARDDVPTGTLLQFVRNDHSQAELALGGLRRGGSLRTALPAEVCRGFTSGKLELRIVQGEADAEVLSTDGPYSLSC
jgi:hypothetical protein